MAAGLAGRFLSSILRASGRTAKVGTAGVVGGGIGLGLNPYLGMAVGKKILNMGGKGGKGGTSGGGLAGVAAGALNGGAASRDSSIIAGLPAHSVYKGESIGTLSKKADFQTSIQWLAKAAKANYAATLRNNQELIHIQKMLQGPTAARAKELRMESGRALAPVYIDQRTFVTGGEGAGAGMGMLGAAGLAAGLAAAVGAIVSSVSQYEDTPVPKAKPVVESPRQFRNQNPAQRRALLKELRERIRQTKIRNQMAEGAKVRGSGRLSWLEYLKQQRIQRQMAQGANLRRYGGWGTSEYLAEQQFERMRRASMTLDEPRLEGKNWKQIRAQEALEAERRLSVRENYRGRIAQRPVTMANIDRSMRDLGDRLRSEFKPKGYPARGGPMEWLDLKLRNIQRALMPTSQPPPTTRNSFAERLARIDEALNRKPPSGGHRSALYEYLTRQFQSAETSRISTRTQIRLLETAVDRFVTDPRAKSGFRDTSTGRFASEAQARKWAAAEGRSMESLKKYQQFKVEQAKRLAALEQARTLERMGGPKAGGETSAKALTRWIETQNRINRMSGPEVGGGNQAETLRQIRQQQATARIAEVQGNRYSALENVRRMGKIPRLPPSVGAIGVNSIFAVADIAMRMVDAYMVYAQSARTPEDLSRFNKILVQQSAGVITGFMVGMLAAQMGILVGGAIGALLGPAAPIASPLLSLGLGVGGLMSGYHIGNDLIHGKAPEKLGGKEYGTWQTMPDPLTGTGLEKVGVNAEGWAITTKEAVAAFFLKWFLVLDRKVKPVQQKIRDIKAGGIKGAWTGESIFGKDHWITKPITPTNIVKGAQFLGGAALNLFVSPAQASTAAVSSGSTSGITTLPQGQRMIIQQGAIQPKRIYDYLRSKGIDHIHAVGIVANIHGESSFKPGAVNPTSGAVGLFQMLGVRKGPFIQAVPDWQTNWKGQIDYALFNEPNGDSRLHGKGQYFDTQYSTPQDATVAFGNLFERHGIAGEGQKRAGFIKSYPFARDPSVAASARKALAQLEIKRASTHQRLQDVIAGGYYSAAHAQGGTYGGRLVADLNAIKIAMDHLVTLIPPLPQNGTTGGNIVNNTYETTVVGGDSSVQQVTNIKPWQSHLRTSVGVNY